MVVWFYSNSLFFKLRRFLRQYFSNAGPLQFGVDVYCAQGFYQFICLNRIMFSLESIESHMNRK